jgi:hypothetical protein
MMREFFHGWRRKTGVVTLVMACVVAGIWVRSEVTIDVVWFKVGRHQYCVHTFPGQMYCWQLKDISMDGASWSSVAVGSADGLSLLKNNDAAIASAAESGRRYVRVWHWPIAILLTLLSAYLILGKPRKRDSGPTQSEPADLS